jgi:hypothetical protein
VSPCTLCATCHKALTRRRQSGVVTNIKFCSRHEMVPRQFGQTPHATRILNTQTEGFSCSKENNARTSLKLQPRPQLIIARWLLSQRRENIEMRNSRRKQFRDMHPRKRAKITLRSRSFVFIASHVSSPSLAEVDSTRNSPAICFEIRLHIIHELVLTNFGRSACNSLFSIR